jgi:Protein of unknown function (DUF3443)
VRSIFLGVMFWALTLAGCGGGDSAPIVATSVSVSPIAGQSVNQSASVNVTASVFPKFGQGVTWSLAGDGLLSNQTASSVTYTASSGATAFTDAVVTATSVDNPAASAYLPITVVPFGVFPNVQPVNVDGGPVPGQIYRNGAFTSVTICTPGTITCQTIDGILVDTESSGLRVLASALPALPPLTDKSGNTINECVQSTDQSYLWGTVAVADVRIAGEVASSISVQAIADPASGSIPSDCTSHGAGSDQDSQQVLGANGILGLGLEAQDCGAACDPSAGGTPPGSAYYACSSGSCGAAFVSLAQQVTHPAVLFAKDNNGAELQFPPLSGAADAVSGSLIFGIGTQANNILGSATIFTVDSNDNFTTNLSNTGQSLTSSFIDSGSSGFFFPDGNLASCPEPNSLYFCPASETPLAAVNIGTNSSQSMINFSVDNAETIFSNSPGDAAISTLAGSTVSGICSGGAATCSFDWGLPFFYGRDVFMSIRGQSVPSGIPLAPWWAYTTGFTK